jgi:hypothetical protein
MNTIKFFSTVLPETNLIYFKEAVGHDGVDNYLFDSNANSFCTVQDFGGEICYVNFFDIILFDSRS